ncbi:MAG: hypothetical protein NC218_11765 [Acetobacter sp.]|nr:hypothetical protein [Acetobacter sp.]
MSNKKREFSKTLLIQESALIWVTTIAYIILAFYCIKNGYQGTLPWLTAGVSLPWVAYGVSQGFYYNKSKAENTQNGIKYELALQEALSAIETGAVPEQTYDTDELDLNGPM